MGSISKTKLSWAAVCLAMAFSNTSCNDLLGPDEETVKVAEQAACSPYGPCGTCGETDMDGSGGNLPVATYGFEPSSKKCRDKTGACEVDTYCTGNDYRCPSAPFASQDSVCRLKTGDCELDTHCTGNSYDCPSPTYRSASWKCHTKTGNCDRDTYCTGTSATCPNFYEPNTTKCHTQTGVCDKDANCTGDSATCPDFYRAGSKCYDTTGACDKDSYCVEGNATCPNWFKSSETVCQAASCSDGVLHPSSSCDGANAHCPEKPPVSCPSGSCDAAGLACTEYLLGSAGSAGASGSAASAGSSGSGASPASTTASRNSSGGNSSVPVGQSGSGAADSTTGVGQGSCLKAEDCPQYVPFCVSGVCCNKACNGQCEACNLEGLEGICSPLPKDRQPVGASCDGSGTSSAGAASTTTNVTGSGATAGAFKGSNTATQPNQHAGRSNSEEPASEDSGCSCSIPGVPTVPGDPRRLLLILAGALAVVTRLRSRTAADKC